MRQFEFAVVTPSYTPDFERCQLLAKSVQKFVQPATHYIIVTQKDFPLFQQLQGPTTEILVVESLIPRWLFKVPLFKNGWLSLKTPPVRNWILQQIVKLSAGFQLEKDVLVYVDSDLSFIRPFNLQTLVRGDQVRLFHADDRTPIGDWDLATAKLLGLPPQKFANYLHGIVTWRHDNVVKLFQHLEAVSGREAIETLCCSWHLSEYQLYGAFVDHFLQEQSGHFWDAQGLCKEYWSPAHLSDAELEHFLSQIEPECVAVMISAKAGISPSRYQAFLEKYETALKRA